MKIAKVFLDINEMHIIKVALEQYEKNSPLLHEQQKLILRELVGIMRGILSDESWCITTQQDVLL